MNRRVFEFTCPHCKKSFLMMKDTFLLKEESSVEYKRLKDQTYFTHVCQNCHEPFLLTYPLIWKDVTNQYILVLSSQEELPAFDLPVTVTKSPGQFLEAFPILDLGLDIKEVLPIKRALESKKGESCVLKDYDADHDILWFECGGQPSGIRHKCHNVIKNV